MFLSNVTRFDSCIFFIELLQRLKVEIPSENSKPHGEALEELIGAQALSADLKTALVACLTGAESRRWTVGELLGRLNLKTRMEGPKIASFCSRVSICGSMGSHPEGPSRSDGISLMLSRLRRFDSRHSRF